MKTANPNYSLADLLRVMERLRDPEQGCPWDLEQNFNSIVPSTLEECYELVAAIAEGDFEHVEEELGDVLFQVVFYSQLAREQSLFDFNSVLSGLVEKLLRRHPHVFADGQIEGLVSGDASLSDVGETWERIKEQERSEKQLRGALADVPLALPALTRAQKLQKRAARSGFDWQHADGVLEKLEEEIGELRDALQRGSTANVAHELGDVLFTCVNLARHLELDAEEQLREGSRRFQTRFQVMEQLAANDGTSLDSLDLHQMDGLWRRAKALTEGSAEDL